MPLTPSLRVQYLRYASDSAHGTPLYCVICRAAVLLCCCAAVLLCYCAVVPEGFYLKTPGQVAVCPLGEYKSGFSAATSCTKCAAGVTTSSVGSQSEAACSVVLPGSYPASMENGIIKSTARCPQRFYCPGGPATAPFDPRTPSATATTTVVQCPSDLWTVDVGASRAEQCSKFVVSACGKCTACRAGPELVGLFVCLCARACVRACAANAAGRTSIHITAKPEQLQHNLCWCFAH
jgi:hypothetical protein